MMKFVLLSLFTISSAMAYVPTVESLFRHGSNPDVISNGMSLTLQVKKMHHSEESQGETLVKEQRLNDHYRLFFTRGNGDSLKIAQARYTNNSFTEGSLEHKIYYPNFNAFTIKTDPAHIEKGLFFAVLHSILYNNGSHLITYLKAAGVPVKLNNEIINREKVEFLATYKRYLALTSQDRSLRKTEPNPLRPEDPTAQDRVERLMSESMYMDQKQVTLSRDSGEMAWMVLAGPFEATVSYKNRHIQRIKFKTSTGEFEMVLKDYWLANGTHSAPRYIMLKSLNGENYQVEVTNLRHYNERDEDLEIGRAHV